MRCGGPVRTASAAFALLLLAAAAPAAAHTHLADLRPEPETVLTHAPRAVTLVFNEPVELVGRATALRNAGRPVGVDVRAVAGGRRLLLVPRVPLRRGRVDVAFRVLSRDGHVLRGRYAFAVRAAAVPGPRADDGALQTSAGGGAANAARALHGVHELLFVLAAGLVLVAPLLAPAAGLPWPAGALRLTAALAVLVALLCATLTWAAADGARIVDALAPAAITDAAGTTPGAEWLERAGLWAVLAVGASALGPRRRPAAPAALVVLALAVSLALSGHAGSHGGAGSVLVDSVHLLSAGAWLGGLAVLAAVRRRGRAEAADATVTYARVALVAFAALVATGVGNGLLRLGGPGGLADGAYGTLVLAKLGLAAAIAVVAGVAAVRGARGGTAQVRAELVLGAAALGVAAVLVETAPIS